MLLTRLKARIGGLKIASLVLCLGAFGLCTPQQSFAISISYEVEDLTDTTVGQDLKRYIYRVSDFDFQRNQGFTIYFDADKFSNLDASLHPNPDWDIIIGEPVPLFGQPGVYDALSMVSAGFASLADPFELSFIWNGAGDPGVQPFELSEFDDNMNFVQLLGSGFTVPAGPNSTVPEAGSAFVLLALGLGSLLGLKRVKRH